MNEWVNDYMNYIHPIGIAQEMKCVFSTDKCSSLEWRSLAKYHQFFIYRVYLTNMAHEYRDSQRNKEERYTYLGHRQVSGHLCCSQLFRQIQFSFEKWWKWHIHEPFLVETVCWPLTNYKCYMLLLCVFFSSVFS